MSDLSNVIGAQTDMHEFKKLQQRLNHEAIRHQFKKKVVGGLDEDDVTKYIEDIEAKFKKLEQEYKNATDETYAVKIKLNKELEERDSLLTKIDELKSDLNDYIVKHNKQETEINLLNEKNKSERDLLKNQIQIISNERNQLKELLEKSTEEIEQLKGITTKFENENAQLKNKSVELEYENTQIPQLLNEKKQLSEETRALNLKISDYSIEIEKLKEHMAKYINDNAVIKSKLSGIEIENTQLSEHRNELIKQMSDSKAAHEQLLDKTARLEDENNALKSKLYEAEKDKELILQLENELTKSGEEISSLNELLIESDKEIRQMKEYVAEFENEENILKSKISELTEENQQIPELKQANNKMAEDIKAFEELLSQSEVEFEQLRDSLERTNSLNINMEAKISELENSIQAKDYKISEINRVCQDLKQQLEIEQSCSEKLNMDLVIFKQKIISLEETITEKLVELEQTRKTKEKAEQELSMEKARVLNYRVNGFKDELSEVLSKLEHLQEEARQNLNSSTFLQQQLTIQQNRADKAENDLQAFMKILTGAKDKFYSERNPFGDQFKQLVEIQPDNEPVINDSLLDM